MAAYTKWIEADSKATLVDVAVLSVRSRLEPVCDYLSLAAEDWQDDVEYVHQLRVWSRRTAAATNMYAPLLPTRRRLWLNRQLKRIRRACNDARDDDVLAERLASDMQTKGASPLLKRVRQHRTKSQQPILRVYQRLEGGQQLKRRGDKLLDRVRLRGELQESTPPLFRDWALDQLRLQNTHFAAAAGQNMADIESMHAFRITVKGFRYALELLAGVLTDSFRDELYPQIQDLQERLGQINDHATAEIRWQRWIEQTEHKAAESYLRDALAEEQQLLQQSRQEFLDWWNDERRGGFCQALNDALVLPT